jgi:hypothetical protein
LQLIVPISGKTRDRWPIILRGSLRSHLRMTGMV